MGDLVVGDLGAQQRTLGFAEAADMQFWARYWALHLYWADKKAWSINMEYVHLFWRAKNGSKRSGHLLGSWEYPWHLSHSFQWRDISQMLSSAARFSPPCRFYQNSPKQDKKLRVSWWSVNVLYVWLFLRPQTVRGNKVTTANFSPITNGPHWPQLANLYWCFGLTTLNLCKRSILKIHFESWFP